MTAPMEKAANTTQKIWKVRTTACSVILMLLSSSMRSSTLRRAR